MCLISTIPDKYRFIQSTVAIGSGHFSPFNNDILLLHLHHVYPHHHLPNLKQVPKNLDLVLWDLVE